MISGTFKLRFEDHKPYTVGASVTSPVWDDYTNVEFVGTGRVVSVIVDWHDYKKRELYTCIVEVQYG